MKTFIYTDNYKSDNSNVFIAHIKLSEKNTMALLKILYKELHFPTYFGFNWDALYDCLCDFHWMTEKNIIIIHDNLPILDVNELKVYLSILIDSIKCWNSGNYEHTLGVVFSIQDKNFIENTLMSMENRELINL
jgi:RNAse (barnase) inhibitor barstar